MSVIKIRASKFMRISLITVAYNSAGTLRDTFESVLAQKFSDFEYIVVDGASRDGTLDLIREYELKFAGKMRWVSEPDKGLYDAMNKGIALARGDIVGILNGDDFYHRADIFQKLDAAFSDPEVDAVFGDVRFVRPGNLEKTVRYYSSKNFRTWRFRFGWMPAHPTFFTFRKNFERFGGYRTDFKIAADFELLLRFLALHKLRFKYLPLDFMKMRTGGVSTRGLKSNWTLNREIVCACRSGKNNISVLQEQTINHLMKILTQELLNQLSAEAAKNPRLRKNYNLHDRLDAPAQRLFNALAQYSRDCCRHGKFWNN